MTDLYIKMRVFAQGSAFSGSRWWNFTFWYLPPFVHQKSNICITA